MKDPADAMNALSRVLLDTLGVVRRREFPGGVSVLGGVQFLETTSSRGWGQASGEEEEHYGASSGGVSLGRMEKGEEEQVANTTTSTTTTKLPSPSLSPIVAAAFTALAEAFGYAAAALTVAAGGGASRSASSSDPLPPPPNNEERTYLYLSAQGILCSFGGGNELQQLRGGGLGVDASVPALARLQEAARVYVKVLVEHCTGGGGGGDLNRGSKGRVNSSSSPALCSTDVESKSIDDGGITLNFATTGTAGGGGTGGATAAASIPTPIVRAGLLISRLLASLHGVEFGGEGSHTSTSWVSPVAHIVNGAWWLMKRLKMEGAASGGSLFLKQHTGKQAAAAVSSSTTGASPATASTLNAVIAPAVAVTTASNVAGKQERSTIFYPAPPPKHPGMTAFQRNHHLLFITADSSGTVRVFENTLLPQELPRPFF